MFATSLVRAPCRHPGSRARCVTARAAAAAPLQVVVTGAAGRTGALATKKLVEKGYEARAVVRSSGSKDKVVGLGVKESNVHFVDVSSAKAEDYAEAFKGADAILVCTSGVPKLIPFSLLKVIWAKVTGQKGVMPDFTWKEGQMPEQVDFLGQKAQFDAAKAAGVKRVVVVGSMGGTQPDNNLNKLGDGNILLWKRKAEEYLIQSGLDYTIVHPGGLLDDKGGERTLKVDVDDKLLAREVRNIPREDVAEVCVQCLAIDEASNRAFDVIALPLDDPESNGPTTDFGSLIASLEGANCDYSIHSQANL